MIAALSPARWGGPADLQLRLLAEGLPQGCEAQALGLALGKHLLQKAGAFEPPMAKEFRIKGGHHHGRLIHHRTEFAELLDARLDVALGVAGGCALSGCWVVRKLGLQRAITTTDAPQLEA